MTVTALPRPTSSLSSSLSHDDRVNSRLARLIAMLHGWVPREDSYDIVIALRAGDALVTFETLCSALNADGVVVSARIAREVIALGVLLSVDAKKYADVSYYAAA